MQSHFLTSDKTRLFFELEGPPNADVVCFSHCFGSNHHYWDEHLPAADGYQVLRYDTRGHGLSDHPTGPYSLSRMAKDVIELADFLSIEHFHFVGVSMGGMIGQTLALSDSSRLLSVTLANTPCHYSKEQIALWHKRSEQVLQDGIESVKPALMQRWFTDQAANQRIAGYDFIEKAFSDFSPESFVAATAAVSAVNTTNELHKIKTPTLLFGSTDDPGVPIEVTEFMAEQITDCNLHWLSPARHLATLEQVDTFNRIVKEFLAEHAR